MRVYGILKVDAIVFGVGDHSPPSRNRKRRTYSQGPSNLTVQAESLPVGQ